MTRGPLGEAIAAYRLHTRSANAAFAVYRSFCDGSPPPRVPGMDTAVRLALRISKGKSIEEAAACEYVYRWRLAIKDFDQCDASAASIFGAPHLLGW